MKTTIKTGALATYISFLIFILSSLQVNAATPLDLEQELDLEVPIHNLEVYEPQPTTYVQSQPLEKIKTRAEHLREERKNIEIQTERAISERLEQERMKEEKQRAERIFKKGLFGNTSSQESSASGVVPHGGVLYGSQGVFYPETAQVAQDYKLDRVKEEIIESVHEVHKKKEEEEEQKRKFFEKDKVSLGVSAGMGMYLSRRLNNWVNGRNSFGVSLNSERLESPFGIEISYHYSRFDIIDGYYIPTYNFDSDFGSRLNQHNIMAGVKYKIFRQQRLKPFVGGVVSYTIRDYRDVFRYVPNSQNRSETFDTGVMIGADMVINDELIIGVDYRHLFNMSQRNRNVWSNFVNPFLDNRILIERSNYAIVSLVARLAL